MGKLMTKFSAGMAAVALALAFAVAAAAPGTAQASSYASTILVNNDNFSKVVEDVVDQGLTNRTLKLIGGVTDFKEVYLTNKVSLTIDLNGYDLIGKGDAHGDASTLFYVMTGCNLVIKDSSVDDPNSAKCGTIASQTSSYPKEYVHVAASATFTLESGRLYGSGPSSDQKAVYVYGNFIMNGGVIENFHTSPSFYQYGYSAVTVMDTGRMTMNGGVIRKNSSSDEGGAIYLNPTLNECRFWMTGGEIYGNSSEDEGGAILVKNGLTSFTGGSIHDNNSDDNCGNNIYVSWYAENATFGGTFSCYSSASSDQCSIGYHSPDRPIFSGSAYICGFHVVGSSPGFTVDSNLDTSMEHHAWVTFFEGSDGKELDSKTILYKGTTGDDRYTADTSNPYDEVICISRCFGVCGSSTHHDVAVYSDGHVGVCENTGSIVAMNFDSVSVFNAAATYDWQKHQYVLNYGSNASIYADRYNQVESALTLANAGAGASVTCYGTEVSHENEKDASSAVTKVVFHCLVANTRNGCTRQEYCDVVVNSAAAEICVKDQENGAQAESTCTKYAGSTMELTAGLPADSNYFKEWNVQVTGLTDYSWSPSDYDWTQPSLSFTVPGATQLAITAVYNDHYAINAASNVTVYRGDTKVTHDQMAGTQLTLAVKGDLAGTWKVTNADGEDVSSAVLTGENTLTMPAYDISVEFVPAETGPAFKLKASSGVTVKANGKAVELDDSHIADVETSAVLTFSLDDGAVTEGFGFKNWVVQVVYDDGTYEDVQTKIDGYDSSSDFSFCIADVADATKTVTQAFVGISIAQTDDPAYLDPQGKVVLYAHKDDSYPAKTYSQLYGDYTLPTSEGCGIQTPDGMEFAGWADVSTDEVVTEGYVTVGTDDSNMTLSLYALWTEAAQPAVTHTVTFEAGGGSGTMDPVTAEEGSYTLPSCGFTAPEGKFFAGWSYQEDGAVIESGTIQLTGDTTLYALWLETKEGYKVTLRSGLDSSDSQYVVRSAGTYVLPACPFMVPANKKFVGWSYQEDGDAIAADSIKLTGDTTLYAVWAAATTSIEGMAVKLSATSYTYDGKAKKPTVTIKGLTKDTDFKVAYDPNCTGAGKKTVTVTGIGDYTGTVMAYYTVNKATPTVKIATAKRTLKASKVKKKAKYLAVLKANGVKGKKTFKKMSGSKKLTITKTGKIKVKKGTKKGTYKIRVKLTSAATANWKAKSVTKTIKVVVK